MKVTDHIRGTSKFVEYRAGNLWFETVDTNLSFNVPVEDLDGASVEAEMKSMMLMRWIRKHVALLNDSAMERVGG